MKTYAERIIDALDRAINAEYSFPTWLWASVSLVVGLLILFLGALPPVDHVVFFSHLPLQGWLFGPLTAGAAILSMYGMAKKNSSAVKIGSMASFCSWIFVGYAFYSAGTVNFFLLPLWLLLFWSYKYLAAFVRERRGL
jgi:hypothetical protein